MILHSPETKECGIRAGHWPALSAATGQKPAPLHAPAPGGVLQRFLFGRVDGMGRPETDCPECPDLSRKSRDSCKPITAACPDCPDLSRLIFTWRERKKMQNAPVWQGGQEINLRVFGGLFVHGDGYKAGPPWTSLIAGHAERGLPLVRDLAT